MPNSTPINRTAEPLLIGGANGDPVLPILIYQMGKVGSTPIMASLAAANLPYAHVHFLSSPHLKEVERYYSTLPQAKIPDHIQRSKQIRSLIDASSGKLKWKVITLVREPISRAVSDVFQNMADTIPGINSVGENSANQIISDYIVDRLDRFDEKTDYLCTWFDKEVKAAFELDVFATPFNQSAGFQIYRSAKADILCLKLENLSACHQQAFGDFLGVRNFKLIDANAASVKPYRGLYRLVQAKIRIPPACLQRIYSSRFVQHFYTPEEIDCFKAKWQRRWGGPLRAAVKAAGIPPPPATDGASDNGAENKTHTVCGVSSRMVPGRIRRLNSFLQKQLHVIALVTPSFNQARYLEACIDSVLSQNYPRLEYVIMDGGSTDNSVAIIKKYEKYLAYWQSRPYGGQYAAINAGFRKTRGEIMTWLNSDDKFHLHAFFIVAAVLRQRPDVEWLTGRSNLYDEQGRQTYICEYLLPYSHAKYLHKKYADPWIQQEGTFWRRSLWDRSGAGVRSDLDFAGDLELWLRFFRTSRLYIVDALLAGYRFQPNSKARLFMEKYRQEADAVIECERKRYPDEGYDKLIPAPESISFLKIQDTATQLIRNFSAADSSALKICDALKSGIDLAIEFYQKSIQTDPNNSRAHNSLGMLYWQSGKSKEALEEFTAALRIDPNYPAPVLSIGDILGIIGKKELKDKLFESYLVKNPRDRKLFEDLANFVIKN